MLRPMALRDSEHMVQVFFADVALHRSPILVTGALLPEGTGVAVRFRCSILVGLSVGVKGSFLQKLPCRTEVGIGLFIVGEPILREYAFSGTRLFVQVFYHRHVGFYPPIVTDKEILSGSVLAIGDNGVDFCLGSGLVRFNQGGHLVSFVDCPRGHLHGSNNFVERINRSMRLVPEFCLASCMADDGGFRIGGGDLPGIHGRTLFLVRLSLLLIQPLLQLPVPFLEVSCERMGIYDRVVRRIGIDEARVHEDLRAVD